MDRNCERRKADVVRYIDIKIRAGLPLISERERESEQSRDTE